MILLTGYRGAVAVGIAVLVGASLATLESLRVTPLADPEDVTLAYNGLIVGNITLITVIVSINQLLLARALQTPGELESQIEDVIDYRSEVERATDEVVATVTKLTAATLAFPAPEQERLIG